jgi:hypothetical protein
MLGGGTEAVATCVPDRYLEGPQGLPPDALAKFFLLHESEDFPKGPIVALNGKGVPVQKLREILLNMHHDEGAKKALDSLGISQFTSSKDSDYDSLFAMADAGLAPAPPAPRPAAAASSGKQLRSRTWDGNVEKLIQGFEYIPEVPTAMYDLLPKMYPRPVPVFELTLKNSEPMALTIWVRAHFKHLDKRYGMPPSDSIVLGPKETVAYKSIYPYLPPPENLPAGGLDVELEVEIQVANPSPTPLTEKIFTSRKFAPVKLLDSNAMLIRTESVDASGNSRKRHLMHAGLMAWIYKSLRSKEISAMASSLDRRLL